MNTETTPARRRHAKTRTRARSFGLPRALLLTLASAVLPGAAHFSRGRRRTALLLSSLFLIAVAVAVVALALSRQQLVGMLLDPAWLLGIMIGAGVLALAWAANVVWSYAVVRPQNLPLGGKVVAISTVTLLCVLVCAPLVLAVNFAQAQRALLSDIFPDGTFPWAAGSHDPDSDPWQPGERLNILLVGGDANPTRPGVRTDVMIVASVDPTTGRTVLLSVPRNMQHAPMPFPAMQKEFPNGFPDFLYGLWRYGVQHPEMVPGNSPPGSQRPGAHLLMETIEETLGLPIDYYALVDLDGFRALINALGGIWIDVQKPIRYGEQGEFVVEEGYRELTGQEALWYSRSRLESSDYDRMRRQRCMLGAIANQADPITVLRNFRELASAAKRTVSTNIPRHLLPEMAGLAPKVKNATITNIQFVPPLIDTGDPDYDKIRRITQRVISGPAGPPRPERSAQPPGQEPATGDRSGQAKSGSDGPTPSSAARGEPVSVTAACPRITEPE